jgi:hypothetical protein
MLSQIERARVDGAVAGSVSTLGELLANPRTTLERIDAPYLARSMILEARRFLPTRPQIVYFAVGPAGELFELVERPEEFNRLLVAEGLEVRSLDTARAIAIALIELTRPQDRRCLVVRSADDIPWRADADEAARARARQLVRPPAAWPERGAFTVSVMVLKDDDLVEETVHVPVLGALKRASKTLATNLPLIDVGG